MSTYKNEQIKSVFKTKCTWEKNNLRLFFLTSNRQGKACRCIGVGSEYPHSLTVSTSSLATLYLLVNSVKSFKALGICRPTALIPCSLRKWFCWKKKDYLFPFFYTCGIYHLHILLTANNLDSILKVQWGVYNNIKK